MEENEVRNVSRQQKINALRDVALYRPRFTIAITLLGIFAAVLEGIGLSFILPIVELVQTSDSAAEADGIMGIFMSVYQIVGIPLTLGTAIIGVSLVIAVRYTASFGVGWLREVLRTHYIRDLQDRAFQNTVNAQIEYFDEEGTDDILNAIVTQTYYAGRVIHRLIKFLEQAALAAIYFLIAFIIAPWLTIITGIILGGSTVFFRRVLESGYNVGDEVAEANERRQEAAQAATQGIRDVRIFDVTEELYEDFQKAIEQYTHSRIILRRNEEAINQFYNLVVAVSIFVLIYLALTFANLSLGALSVFLFAMFRLGPTASSMNRLYYQIENDLPHLVRTLDFNEELKEYQESSDLSGEVPEEIRHVEFDNVWFSYNDDEEVLRGVNFEVKKDEFIGFVGESGAGKSTIVSLLSRMYNVGRGEIRANGVPISKMDIDKWRDRISVVRQDPFIFNDTLRYNLTLGNREVTETELNRICEITKVNKFANELSMGYDTLLGDEGVRLSGGQKQRVALARALVKEADLLILDEATSDLDSKLEREVQRAIENMDQEYIIITIAHRLSTVENADRIYTIEQGKVIESGSHQELLNQNGKYEQLYRLQ